MMTKNKNSSMVLFVLIFMWACGSEIQSGYAQTTRCESDKNLVLASDSKTKGKQETEDRDQEEIEFFDAETTARDIDGGTIEVDDQGRTRFMVLHMAEEQQVVELIQRSPHVVSVNLEFSNVSDSILEAISGCHHLEEIFLGMPESQGEDGAFSNRTAKKLSALKRLRVVHLRSDKIDDKGIKHFANLAHLEDLDLTGCQVTDASVPVLSKMSKLEQLNLTRTLVTQESMDALAKALPKTKIKSGN